MDEDKEYRMCKIIKQIIDIKNVTAVFFFTQLFKLSSSFEFSMSLIERCFSIISDSTSFLELDIVSVVKILSSNELSIDSEIEVADVAEKWLLYETHERSKHAQVLLHCCRLPLLSVPAMNYVLNKPCFANKALKLKKRLSPCEPATRYCSQNNFNIVVIGGKLLSRDFVVSDVYRVDVNRFDVRNCPELKKGRRHSNLLCVKGELYAFGGLDANDDVIMSIEKYSPATNVWENIAEMCDDRWYFCACSYMSDAYVLAGRLGRVLTNRTNSCARFNIKTGKWTEIARLEEARSNASCAVFEGRVVVSGGFNDGRDLSSVEAYDHVADLWSCFPGMVERRSWHGSIARKNKLFVVGALFKMTYEVFDSTCGKFVLLTPPTELLRKRLSNPTGVFTVGCKLVVIYSLYSVAFTYNIDEGGWRKELCEYKEGLIDFKCAKVPHFTQTTI